MAISYSKEIQTIFTFENIVVGDSIVTTNATPTILFSFPIGMKGYLTSGEFAASIVGGDSVYGGQFWAEFRNGSGTVEKISELINESVTLPGGLLGISIVANTPSQSIDIIGTGIAVTNIAWAIKLTFKYKT